MHVRLGWTLSFTYWMPRNPRQQVMGQATNFVWVNMAEMTRICIDNNIGHGGSAATTNRLEQRVCLSSVCSSMAMLVIFRSTLTATAYEVWQPTTRLMRCDMSFVI